MIHLVIGGSGSGKSAYAEQQITAYGEEHGCISADQQPYLYIATMMPFGTETEKKIERHRKMRAGKGFESVDCYRNLKDLEVPENQGILLECMSNLAANEMFGNKAEELCAEMSNRYAEESRTEQPDAAMEQRSRELAALEVRILCGIRHLAEHTTHLVIVTNDVHEDSLCYDKETENYRWLLGGINQKLAAMADVVTEVACGVPVCLKDSEGRGKKTYMEMTETAEDYQKSSLKSRVRLVIGGAYQGKTAYAKEAFPKLSENAWVDGRDCALDEIFTCRGMHHFHEYLHRYAKCVLGKTFSVHKENSNMPGEHESSCDEGTFTKEQISSVDFNRIGEDLAEDILLCNPNLILVSDEIGCGIVPVDPFERAWREMVGRTVTKLAVSAMEVHRVSMGIGTVIKKES